MHEARCKCANVQHLQPEALKAVGSAEVQGCAGRGLDLWLPLRSDVKAVQKVCNCATSSEVVAQSCPYAVARSSM